MKNKARRIISMICALAMCAAMVPASVLAEDPPADTFSVEQTADDASSSVPGTEGTTGGETETGPSLTGQEPGSEPDPDGTDTMPPPVVNEQPVNEQPVNEPLDDVTSGDPSAREPSTDPVAQIGEVQYTTLDEAVEEAEEGATIVLLKDCELTKGFNKTLTFTGNGKIKIDKQLTSNGEGWMCFGLYDPSRVLTFDGPGVEVEWTSDGSAPWLMLSLSGTLTVTNGAKLTFYFDSRTTGTRNAIYMNSGSELNVTNGSSFQILGVGTASNSGQGIQLDSPGTATINVTGNSTFLIDGTNRGYVNSPTVYVKDSSFTVQNCTSNGSNGGKFTAINSQIKYEGNNGHGLSASDVTIVNSTLNCNNNAYYGLTYSGNMTMDATAVINANENGYGYTGGGLRASSASSTSTVATGAVINVLNNKRNGVENYGTFTFAEGSKFTVTGNNEPSTNGGGIYNGGTLNLSSETVIMNNSAAQTGGGICNAGTVVVPVGVKLYNNHANIAGDDIYSRDNSTITFAAVGSDWILDDCSEAITGWFDDSENDRWNGDDGDGICHAVEFTEFSNGVATVTGLHALKAAHGITATIDPADITVYMGGDNGYTSVLNGEQTENDVVTESSNSLPEPGFYITLPKDINTALQNAQVSAEGETADLSDYLSIRTQDGSRRWKLEPYGGNYSGAYDRFIYRILPADAGQAPVCLQFTSEDGSFYTSDIFEPAAAGALNQKYTMGIYPGLTDTSSVMLDVTIDDETYTCTVKLETGDLTIRYVTGEQDSVVTDVVEDIASTTDRSKAYAQTQPGTTFTINESRVDVTAAAAPSLLFDDVVTSGNTAGAQDYDVQLKDRAVQTVGVSFANLQYQAKYLDLVDANNGNVWLKASKPVTVYWPYPQGTDKNTTFYLVHFSDLNREMANSEIAGNIAASACEAVEVTNTDYGIAFEADSFSPYVLMWDNSTTAVSTPTPDEHPDIAEGIANGTWGGTPTPTPIAQTTVIPQTSDSLPLGMLIVVAVAAAGAVVVLLVLRKRRSR